MAKPNCHLLLISVRPRSMTIFWNKCSPPSILRPPPSPESGVEGHLEDQSPELLALKMRQHQISNDADKTLMLQQHFLLSRGLIAVNGLRSPTGADAGLVPVVPADHNDFVDASSFKSDNLANDGSVKALFSDFTGSLDQTANLPQHLHRPQAQNHGIPSAMAAASGTTGGAAAGPPKQRVRARRGQATDPHSIAERLRRERIAERMKSLQELVPNANKTDKASMLDEIIDYVKFLQLQVKVLSMSRLGGAAAVSPLVADEGRSINGTQLASSSSIMNDSTTVTEHQVLKLMKEDMGSAMQYLQGKGLCLMPISLATAISTNNLNTSGATINPLHNGEAGGPSSPSMSVSTVQSYTMGVNGRREVSVKDATSTSKLD